MLQHRMGQLVSEVHQSIDAGACVCVTWQRRACSLVSLVSEAQEEELSRELLLPPVGRSWQHFPKIFAWPSLLFRLEK